MATVNKTDHTITALVEDKPGVLARVSGLFRRRGFNISNLSVGHSEVPCVANSTPASAASVGIRSTSWTSCERDSPRCSGSAGYNTSGTLSNSS